jgi:hypothetical protein
MVTKTIKEITDEFNFHKTGSTLRHVVFLGPLFILSSTYNTGKRILVPEKTITE